MASIRYLTPPYEPSRQFNRNFIDRFVVEFRFPALLEIGQGGEPVLEIQKTIRTKYPIYSNAKTTEFTPAGQFNEVIHEFHDKDRVSSISLKNSSVSFSTSKYKNFADAEKNCEFLMENVVPHLQTNFFTRVGMRYINKLTIENTAESVNESVNNKLNAASEVLGSLTRFKSEYAGKIDKKTTYMFRCGISDEQDRSGNDGPIQFVLDFDYSQQDVEVDRVFGLLNSMHEKHFGFFWWSLGAKARDVLKNA